MCKRFETDAFQDRTWEKSHRSISPSVFIENALWIQDTHVLYKAQLHPFTVINRKIKVYLSSFSVKVSFTLFIYSQKSLFHLINDTHTHIHKTRGDRGNGTKVCGWHRASTAKEHVPFWSLSVQARPGGTEMVNQWEKPLHHQALLRESWKERVPCVRWARPAEWI